jgi:hypothetical protein
MALADCYRKSPATVHRLATIAGALIDRVRHNSSSNRLAREAFRSALVLEPDSDRFLGDAAVLDEFLEDFAAARDKWTRKIRLIEAQRVDRHRLVGDYHVRVFATIKLAEQRASRGRQSEAASLYGEALDDLRRSRALMSPQERGKRFTDNIFLNAQVELRLGTLEAHARDAAAASEHYEKANALAAALPEGVATKDQRDRLTSGLERLSRQIAALAGNGSVAAR